MHAGSLIFQQKVGSYIDTNGAFFIYLANNFIAAEAIQCSGLHQGFQPVPIKQILVDNANCSGEESTLQMCDAIRVGSCGTSGHAGVRCEGMCNNFVIIAFF